MTIYDLEKQATPMPWTVNESDPSWPMHSYELDGQFFTVVERANAKLSAHCRNHFMEALEALKTANDTITDLQDNEGYPSTMWLRALISKLEEVK